MIKKTNNSDQKKIALCLMGPTACGKSQLAEEIAKALPAEIINVDSALVYRDMDIGTAKPSQHIQQQIPHHLINIRDPKDAYSAAEFTKDAHRITQEVIARKHLPLLVGGTMLYFKALLHGLSDLPSSNLALREQLNQELEKFGLSALHDKLKMIDSTAANKIHANDPQRTLRALEVFYLTGKKLSQLQNQRTSLAKDIQFCCIALAPLSREALHQRIEQRFHQMLQAGFIKEVEKLYQRSDLHADLPSIRAVGYRQAWHYLQGEITFEAMTEQAIAATRQLAKRQLTWLRSWPDLHWLDSDDPELVTKALALIHAQQTND